MNQVLYLLALAALFLAPGLSSSQVLNRLFLCALILLLVEPVRKRKMDWPQYWLLAWIGWVTLCSFCSPHEWIAWHGFFLRWEGMTTLMLLGLLAANYWKIFTDLKGLRIALSIVCAFIIFTLPNYDKAGYATTVMSPITLSGFAALAGVALGTWNAGLLTLALPILICTENRSALLAVMGGMVFYYAHALIWRVKRWHIVTACACLFVLVTALIPRLATVDAKTLGFGSRAQWILQADKIASSLPLTGYGLDTQGFYLECPTGAYVDKARYNDRVHNVTYDLILQTGWIGYTLMALAFGAALGIAWIERKPEQVACCAMVVAWVLFGLLNPQGVPAHALALIAMWGVRRDR